MFLDLTSLGRGDMSGLIAASPKLKKITVFGHSPQLVLDLLTLIAWTYQYYFQDFFLFFWSYLCMAFGLIAAAFLDFSLLVKI